MGTDTVICKRKKEIILKRLIQEIHKGKNLESNLKVYRDLAVQTYCDYAALELTFASFTMIQEIAEEKEELAAKEKTVIDSICLALEELGSGTADYDAVIGRMQKLRQEITDKMDLFTAYTDRLICYEYVLNRMELKYLSAKELNQRLAAFDEEAYMQSINAWLFASKDQSVIRDKMRFVVGQVPVHMTKSKLFEKIGEAMTLYKDGDRSALDDFVYMVRTAAMVYEPEKCVGEYPAFEEVLDRLMKADYTNMKEAEYEEMVQLLEEGARSIHQITDFYYSLQKVVNGIYAVCLTLPYCVEENKLGKACRSIWACLAKKEYRDEMLYPLEGRIEESVEKTSYLESVLFEIKTSYKKELEKLELTGFFEDFSLVANLLSDSLFIDLDKVAKEEKVDAGYVKKRTEELLDELSEKMSQVSRPVKRAMMGQILEKLPMMFQRAEEVQEYIRTNLFGCQDKAEKCIVMTILWDLIQEEV